MTLTVEIQEQWWRQFVQQESIAPHSDMRNNIFAGRKESFIEEYIARTKCTHPYRNKGRHMACLGIVSCELVARPYSNLTIYLVIYKHISLPHTIIVLAQQSHGMTTHDCTAACRAVVLSLSLSTDKAS